MATNLYEDWLKNRDRKTMVSRFDKEEDRIGWEDKRIKGKGYSSLLYNFENAETEALLRKSYQVAKTRLSSMGLFNVRLVLSTDTNSTNGKTIKVSTSVMDETKMDPSGRMDVFLGEVVHEAAHVLYTKFNVLQKSMLEFTGHVGLMKTIWNIIEDEYIERSIGRDFPGYTAYLSATKKHILSTKLEPVTKSEELLSEIINIFLQFIRFPLALNPDIVSKHEKLLVQLKAVFNVKYPESTQESMDKSTEIYLLLKDYYKEAKEEEKAGKSKGGKGESSSESDGKESGTLDSDEEKSKSDEEEKAEEKSKPEEEEESANVDIEKDEYLEELVKTLNAIFDPSGDKSGTKSIEASEHVNEMTLKELEGFVEVSGTTVIIRDIPKGKPDEYETIRKGIASSISTLSKQLTFDTFQKENELRGLRNGTLDTGKIAEAVQGVQTVYTVKHDKKVKGGVIALLIDESGSMGTYSSDAGKTVIKVAQELAILFVEALKKTKYETLVYGHTADRIRLTSAMQFSQIGTTYLKVYKEPGTKDRFNLSGVSAQANNRDGDAIRAVAKKIREHTQNLSYMIVLSDGAPNAQGYSGYTDTRDAVKEVTRNGVIPIGIGINVHYNMDEIYDYYLNFNDLSNFSRDVGKLIRKIIKK